MSVRLAAVLAATLMVSACTTDDDRSAGNDASAKERSVATSLINQVRSIDGLPAQPTDASGLLAATTFGPVVSMLAPDGMSIALPGRNHVTDLRPCVTQTSDTLVYTDCKIAEHVVEGSLSAVDQRLKAEIVDVFVMSPESHGASTVKASLHTFDTHISGTLQVDVMWTTEAGDNTLAATVRFQDVSLDATGCAVGGSLTVKGQLGDNGDEQRTMSFGPTCGDIRVTR